MDPRHLTYDERFADMCPACASAGTTDDHVPPKVFLDDPMPVPPRTVRMCTKCNNGASMDEEYVACLIEVLATGTTELSKLRLRVQRSMAHSGGLRKRLQVAANGPSAHLGLDAEPDRLARVMKKIGCGLWFYELNDWVASDVVVSWRLVREMNDLAIKRFTSLSDDQLLPEVGSRMFNAMLSDVDRFLSPGWIVVQPGRFGYVVDLTPGRSSIRMLFSEYLAVEMVVADA